MAVKTERDTHTMMNGVLLCRNQ